ncbi:MAG: aminotransferase class I/II-fold pyridoxal phosphate-dependent enzyme, partial [Desulfobacteraceae bacterium]|nr:aminotransferase class I/II-fold pyridoxal phosphate-dependent enzyme [Desulfobacteraceae bacterium]
EAVRVCLQSAADKIESGGRKELAERLRYKSTYIGERKKMSDLIGDVSGELIGGFVEDVGLSNSLGLYSDLRQQQEAKLRQLYLKIGSPEPFKLEAAKLRSDTRAMSADVKRKALELFHQQYDRLHRYTPLGLPPERQIYPASRFFSGLIGDVFYNGTIRDAVEQQLGVKPAKLSAGINYFDAPRALLSKLIESLTKESLDKYYQDYSHQFGGGNVRKVIADYENSRARREIYSANNVAVTLGATGAIFFAYKFMEELRRRNSQFSHVLAPVPAYYASASIATYLGFNVVEIMSGDSRSARFLPTPIEIREAMEADDRIKMLSLANPNNPTGEIYGYDELSEIVSIAKIHGAYILYDEIFSELMLTEENVPNIATIAQKQDYLDHLMRVTSWSKDRCIPGFRVGYLVADESILSEIMEFPEWLYANPPTVLNGVIERDLTYRQMMERGQGGDEDFDSYKADLQNNDARYRENLGIIRARLADTQKFTILQPKAAFNMFVRLKDMESFDQYDFAKKLFMEKGVEVHPGPGFGWTQQEWEQKHGFWIRITFAIKKEELERGLNGLLEFIDECKNDPNKVKRKTPRVRPRYS